MNRKEDINLIMWYAGYDVFLAAVLGFALLQTAIEQQEQTPLFTPLIIGTIFGCIWGAWLLRKATDRMKKGEYSKSKSFEFRFLPFRPMMYTLPLRLSLPLPIFTGLAWILLFCSVLLNFYEGFAIGFGATALLLAAILVFSAGLLVWRVRLPNR